MKPRRKLFKITKVNSDFYFTPRGPWEAGRASFSLLKGQYEGGKKQRAEAITTPFLQELNQRYKSGALSIQEGREELEAYRDQLYKELAEKKTEGMNRSNVDLIEGYIKAKIDPKVDILVESRQSQRDSAWRLAKLFGQTRIATATTSEIQRALNTIQAEGSFKQEFRSMRSLLKFIHRHADAEALKTKKFKPTEPVYLTKEQVAQLVKSVPEKVSKDYPAITDLILLIYNLGVRVGEALALEKSDVVKRSGIIVVRVDKQLCKPNEIERDGRAVRDTKNKKSREVVPLDWEEFRDAFTRWLKACPDHTYRHKYRTKVSKLIHDQCVKLFAIADQEVEIEDSFFFEDATIPNAEDLREYKGVHMLRASHARVIVDLTGNENYAAKQIGDSPEVLRRHYSGSTNSEKAMAAFAKMLKSN